MSRLYLILIISLLLASGLYSIPRVVPLGHAGSAGVVCIASNGSTSCPVTPPLINTTSTIPQPLLVAIIIANSSAMNSFDIILHTNSTILTPTNATLGNVLASNGATTLAKCIGGVGIGCGPLDNINTLHFSVSSSLTNTPTNGLLFTASYTVNGSPAFNIPIGFLAGCTGTSVSGICVTIGSGTPNPDLETAQGAKFTNQPYFDLQPALNVGSISVAQGTSDSSSLFLNVTSINGFSGTVSLTASVSPSGPTVTVTPTSVTVDTVTTTSFSSVNVTVSFAVPPGNYALNFTGTSGARPPNTLIIPLTVPAQDFTLDASPSALQFNATYTSSSVISISSKGNFAGVVNLTLTKPLQLSASFASCLCNKAALKLHGGGSNSTTVILNSTVAGTYDLNILGVSVGTQGPLSHSLTVKVAVLDFSIGVSPETLKVPLGTSLIEGVNFQNSPSTVPHNFTVTVTQIFTNEITRFGPVGPSTGISVTCTPTSVNLVATGTQEPTSVSNCSVFGNQVGNYTVTVIGTTGAGVHTATHSITFPVLVIGPDFVITASQSIEPVNVGSSTTISVLLTRSLGLNDTLSLSVDFPSLGNPPSPPSATISPGVVVLNATYPNATAIVTITVSGQAPTGTYFLQVLGHSPVTSIDHTFLIAIIVTTTTSPHDLAIYSVTSSSSSTTVGSNVTLTIVVQNLGKLSETSTVIALAGDTSVAAQNVTIAPGENATVVLVWDTNGYDPGAFMVGAKVLGVNGETILSNNLLRSPSPVTLSAANTSLLSSPYFLPTIIAALVVILGIVGFLFLQTRRKTRTT